ncbi:hypothetical protein V6N12_024436 [Hibiscus sabdariffa]|uniref:Uncharacterized protein n=1 Tax=Hibiscus sabdariffa TaxID=183260 RepID=A0ABR2G128_9ROSI
MCLIQSIIKGRKNDIGAIINKEIKGFAEKNNGILAFPSWIMQLCELKGVKSLKNEKRIINKGPINKVLIERMVHTSKVPTPRVGNEGGKGQGKDGGCNRECPYK